MNINNNTRIAVIGMGYVGLPLTLAFGKKYETFGFDIDEEKILSLKKGLDPSKEQIISHNDLTNCNFTNNLDEINSCNFFSVCVPTPIDKSNLPNMDLLENVCKMLGPLLKKNDVIVFESTVYPGATEEFCIPILEKFSGLVCNVDFGVGYSPERVNPGDKERGIEDIIKITSGSNPEIGKYIDKVYSDIIKAGTYLVDSIKIAEASKIIENVQRDINIALMNELSQLFSILEIPSKKVIEAASTKWNFHSYFPGLVGGHCIGVDPYYLAYKAKEVGLEPDLILAGRRRNEGMIKYLFSKISDEANKRSMNLEDCNFLLIGLSFKENTSDIRNSKAIELCELFLQKKLKFNIYDPLIEKKDLPIMLQDIFIEEKNLKESFYDSIILLVPHDEIMSNGDKWILKYMKDKHMLIDLKSVFPSLKDSIRL